MRERHRPNIAFTRSFAVVGVLAAVMLATTAFANSLARLSFDRQVVAADVFIIGVGVGDRTACAGPSSFVGDCTTVRVLEALKGEAPSEVSLSREWMGIAETNVDCCEAGQVYAMALVRNRENAGVYNSTNGRHAVYPVEASWPASTMTAVRVQDSRYRLLSFDQQVVASDAFVIAVGAGDRHQCRDTLVEAECTTFTLVQAMKGEVASVFELRVFNEIFDIETLTSTNIPYGFDGSGEVYAMALTGNGDRLNPLNMNAIHRLTGP